VSGDTKKLVIIIMRPAVSFQIMCREFIITGESSIFLEVTVSVTIRAEFT